jgi:Uma2 family endonuclease
MAVSELVSVEQYLKTTYRPDCDYVDGEVRERNLGERDHGDVQRQILVYLCSHFPGICSNVIPEQRVQVQPARFRVPDICVVHSDAPREQIVRTAPALCIEILSKDDTMNGMMERVKDYFEMGVPVCWIINPRRREAWIATPGLLVEPTDGILRAGGIEVPLAEVLEPISPGV